MQPTDKSVKRRRVNPTITETGKTKVTNIDTTAARLNTHEEVCSWRYANLDEKMKTIEDRLDTLEADVKDLKSSNAKGFNEVKEMLADARDEKFKTIITVAGTIVVALLGMMGYLLSHVK